MKSTQDCLVALSDIKEHVEKLQTKLKEHRLTDKEIKLLSEVYGTLWIEAYYDFKNEHTQKFAKPIADKMAELNKSLKFKD